MHSKANGATVQRISYTKHRAQYKAARITCAVPAKTRPSQSKSPLQNKAKPCNHRVFAKQGKLERRSNESGTKILCSTHPIMHQTRDTHTHTCSTHVPHPHTTQRHVNNTLLTNDRSDARTPSIADASLSPHKIHHKRAAHISHARRKSTNTPRTCHTT